MRDGVHNPEVWKAAAAAQSFNQTFEKPDVILLDSTYCSMGRMIAIKALQDTDYTYYDAEGLLDLLNLDDAKKAKILSYDNALETDSRSPEELQADPAFQEAASLYNRAIEKAMEKGRCLIHERGTLAHPAMDGKKVLTMITWTANEENKRERALLAPENRDYIAQGIDVDTLLERQDHKRQLYRNALDPDHPWRNLSSYDLAICTDALPYHCTIAMIHGLLA